MDWVTSINAFKQYLRLERAMSSNTIEAYLSDIGKLRQYAEMERILPNQISAKDIQGFLEWVNEFGISTYTQARILSGIKAFYLFLNIEYNVTQNPTVLIQTPRLGRKIPDVLNITEIDELLSAIDRSTPEGTRNK